MVKSRGPELWDTKDMQLTKPIHMIFHPTFKIFSPPQVSMYIDYHPCRLIEFLLMTAR